MEHLVEIRRGLGEHVRHDRSGILLIILNKGEQVLAVEVYRNAEGINNIGLHW